MEVRYCLEEEVAKLTGEFIKMAKEQKRNINIIPQFVGAVPSAHSFGPPSTPYKSIILYPWPKEVITIPNLSKVL